jgi:type IV secretion system protein VirB6
MNAAVCQQALGAVGSGVASSLQGVDCAATAMAQSAFGRLFGTDGALMPVLTIAFTLYVAFFAFSLITGRSALGISALTPRMVTLGVVLTFATSWTAFNTVVWNLAVETPEYLAQLMVGGGDGTSTQVFAQKIDVVMATLMEATGPTSAEGAGSTFSPPGLLWLGATLLLLGTAGLLATCKIALAVLLALGPMFIIMAMFRGTRGLFAGWVKGLVMLALAPMFAVIGGSLMLELAVPVLSALAQTPGQIDARAAMAFFMIAAIHCALMLMVLKVSGTMVAGWSVFGLAGSRRDESRSDTVPASQAAAVAAYAATPRAETAAAAATASRQIRVAAATPQPANDAGASAAAVLRRETQLVSGTAAAGPAPSTPSRARGIGSRFRAPAPRSARLPETTR